MFIEADMLNGQMKESIKKYMKFDDITAQRIYQKVKTFTLKKSELLDTEELYASKTVFFKERERISYSSFDILRTDFRKLGVLLLKKRAVGAKKSTNKFNIKSFLPTILNKHNTIKDDYERLMETHKEESTRFIITNRVRIAKWTRKWIKNEK